MYGNTVPVEMKVAVAAAAVALVVAWRRWRARPLPTAIGALELSEFQLLPTSAQQPKRIAIVGVAGVGKSWLAEACTARLGIPRLELDRMLEHRWREGAARKDGSGSDLTDMRKALKKNAGWVADGNFRAAVLEVWPRAELIVVLDLPMPLAPACACFNGVFIFFEGTSCKCSSGRIPRARGSCSLS